MAYVIGIIVFVIVIVLIYVTSKSRYYGKIFSPEHYDEIFEWATFVLLMHPVKESSFEDGSAILTKAKIALAYTSGVDDGIRTIHFSISQGGGYTTQAVGNRMIFLLIRLLHKNQCQANFFQTESTVHHAVFSMPETKEWITSDKDAVIADMENCQRVPVQTISVPQQDAEPDTLKGAG
ncbi:hypothetical protein AMJ80_11820 [bacterium SM23_31]|nr:MAG: hypothetical protein AMJ80_11820 [bacterium SM23_31]